ncbi:unnamed protein product [Cochlearia groenlandica]
MAKKTQRRAARQEEKDHLGCMWGFMNMFNPRHGPLSHKMLLDQKHGNPPYLVETLHVGEERNVTITIIKPSVKKLIAEELSIEKENKKRRENAEAEQLSDAELQGRRRKNHRRKSKKSCNDLSKINTIDSEEPEHHRRNQKHHGSDRSVDIDNMIEEFYSETHRRSRSCVKNGMVNHKHRDCKEKLSELVKFLISQKLLHGNHPKENSEILTCKDLMEVFQILGSDEELFLKLLQDPEILVPRGIQDSQNGPSQKGEESLRLLEITGASDTKWSSFFRRKDAPQEVADDKATDRIFILNPPRPASFSSPGIGNSCGLSPDSHLLRNKAHSDINSSHFFLSVIKRKLKQAISKEQPRFREEFTENVPTKYHFFLERMAKPSTSQKKPHNVPQKHNEDDKMQRVSNNIYIEAKKHLSEMLSNGDLDSNTTASQVRRTFGRILSFPEHLSPLSSPGRRWEKTSTAHRNINKETHASKQEDAVENADIQICNLSQEPDKSLQRTASEPTEDRAEGTPNEDKISSEGTYNFVSLCHENTVTNLPSSADDVMIVNEIDIVPEEASSTLVDGLSKVDAHHEHRDASPSNCLAKREERQAITTDLTEWSSPISVLEPLFTEDDVRSAKVRSQSGEEAQVQPWCIHFAENDSAAQTIENSVKTIASDKELVLKYVKAVLDAVGSDFKELYLKAQLSDQLLEPALISNIRFCPNQLCPDHELLFDCINEVLMELCCCCPPWVSLVTPKTRVFSTVESIIHEVQEAVYWHLLPLPLPHALDQIVRKDVAKAGNLFDIRCDIECIGFEASELILDELLEELTLNFLNNTE